MQKETSYRQIFKSTSLFGGVQVLNIIISIIKSKILAVLLGPTGMGFSGLYTSAISLIGSITNLGLGTSSVKDIAQAFTDGNPDKIATVITVLRRLVWITGLIGTSIMILFSPILSQITFGNKNFTLGIIWVSISILFTQLSSGQLALLQGMRKLQYLAKANLSGTFFGLLISVPIYYFWRLDGIVPAIIISSFISLSISWFFSRKIKIDKVNVDNHTAISVGKDMIKMGILLSLSGFISILTSYIIRIYISNKGGINQVGLYTAGFAIIHTYVSMIFTAMSTDYYPRLAGVASNKEQTNQLINHQAEIALLIIAPILCIFLILINWIIIILYSTKFIHVNEMLYWAALGMYFKAASWPIGFVFLAKGDSKIFFLSELFANSYILLLNVVGYKFWGLEGLGISFLIGYVIVYIQVFIIARFKYSFFYKFDFYKIFTIQLIMGTICFLIARFIPSITIWSIIIIIISMLYSYVELNKKLNIRGLIRGLKDKYINK